MSVELQECRIRTPEEYLGDVMGRLTVIGAALGYWPGETSPKNENGVVFFSAQVPVEALNEFKTWLKSLSDKATIEDGT